MSSGSVWEPLGEALAAFVSNRPDAPLSKKFRLLTIRVGREASVAVLGGMMLLAAAQPATAASGPDPRDSLPSFSATGIVESFSADRSTGEMRRVKASSFTFSHHHGVWQMEHLMGYPALVRGNGLGCRRIPEGMRLSIYVPTAPTNFLVAEAYSFVFPPPEYSELLLCWLALCPRPELPLLPNGRIRRLIERNFLSAPDNAGPCEFKFLEANPNFLEELSIGDDGKIYAMGGRLIPYVPPFPHGITERRYRLMETTNFQGTPFPLKAVWQQFSLVSGAKSPRDVDLRSEVRLTVHALESSPVRKSLLPWPDHLFALDYRFVDAKHPHRLGYVVTNDVWESTNSADLQSLIKPFNPPRPRAGVLRAPWLMLLFALPLPAIWFVMRGRRKPSTITSVADEQ